MAEGKQEPGSHFKQIKSNWIFSVLKRALGEGKHLHSAIMSFLMGTAAGGLTAAAVYYGFSRTFETRTNSLSRDLHTLSTELAKPPVPGPLPASARIHKAPFRDMVQQRWNKEIENAVMGANRFGKEWDWKQQWDHLRKRVESLMQ